MSDLETSDIRGIIQDDGPPTGVGPTARNPALTPATTIYRDRTAVTGGYWQNMPDATGVLGWVPMTGGGGPAATMWKYTVYPGPGEPIARYTTIADAIADAIVDLHGPGNPADIVLFNADFDEHVDLPDGINLLGWGRSYSADRDARSNLQGMPRILQGVTCGTDGAVNSITGVAMLGTEDDVPFVFSALGAQLSLTDCVFQQDVAGADPENAAILFDGDCTGSEVSMQGCEARNVELAEQTMLAIRTTDTLTLELTGNKFLASAVDGNAINTDTALRMARSSLAGAVLGTDFVRTFEWNDNTLVTSNQTAIVLSETGPLRVYGGEIDHTSADPTQLTVSVIAGAGVTWACSGVAFPGLHNFATTLGPATPLTYGTRAGTQVIHGPAIAAPIVIVTPPDLVVVNTTGAFAAAVPLELPKVNRGIQGQPVCVAHVADGGTGNTVVIDSVASPINFGVLGLVTLAVGEAATFVPDLVFNTWILAGRA